MSKHYKMLFVGLSIIALMAACGDQNPKVQSTDPWSDTNRQQQSNPDLSVLTMRGTDGPATGVCLVGNTCYVTDAVGGLGIFDISNPAEPVKLGAYSIANAYRVRVYESMAFLTGNFNGVAIIDIRDFSNLRLINNYGNSPAGNPYCVNNTLYLPVENTLTVLNIADASTPQFLGKIQLTSTPWDVYVQDQYAALAMGDDGLLILNIQDPENISQTSYVALAGVASELAVKDDYLYVACQEAGLLTIDVHNIQQPALKGQFSTPSNAYGVSVLGNYAYLATDSPGMMVVNITDPSHPTFVKVWADTESSRDIAAAGNFVYLADQAKGLIVMKFKY